MKNFNLIEMAKAMKEHKLRHMWRYAAMMALLLTLACGNLWGGTFGLGTSVSTSSGATGTKDSLATISHLTLTKEIGKVGTSKLSDSLSVYSSGNQAVYGVADGVNKPTAQYSIGSYKWGKSRSSYSPNLYLGYKVEIEDGYTLSLSALTSLMFVSSDFTYKVVILNKNKVELFSTSSLTISNYNAKNSANAQIDSVLSDNANLQNLTDSIFVRAYMYKGSTSKYFCFPKLQLTGDVASSAACTTPADPTGFSAGSITSTGATFTITDDANTNNYDIYYSTESMAPTPVMSATTTSTSKTKAITGLTSGTTYYAWVRSVCDASHKSDWVALGSGSFTTLTTPTATFSNSTYAIGGSALNLSSLWESNSDGAVTFSVDSAGTTGASVSTAAFSATTAGYAKVKAVQAANGSYDAITKYAYIQVGSTEMGSHTITYNLKVNDNSTTLKHCVSVIPTSLYLSPSKAIGTSGSAGALSSSQGSAQSSETQKFFIDNSTSAYNSSNYVSYTFTVTDGYTFEPTSVTVKFQSVSGLCNFHYELTDGVNTISKDFAATTSTGGTPEDAVWSGSGTTLSGTVTLKVFAYKQADAATAYRFGTPITITGTVAEEASCSAPTAVYVTQTAGSSDMVAGESFTLSAATSTGVEDGATYQWYRNSTEVGTNSPTYTIPSCTKVDAGTYWCKITNPCGESTTNSTGYGIKVWQVLLYSSSWNAYDLTSTGTKTGTLSRRLTPGTYYIKLTHNNGVDFGVNTGGTISEITATTPSAWTLYGSQNNIKLTVTTAGYYTFDVDYTSANNPTLSVTFPSATISSCDKIYFCPSQNSIATGSAKFSIYFWNDTESGWASCYLVDGTNYADDANYVAFAPSTTNGWKKMIVVRDDEYATSFDGIWNQSQDISYNGYDYIVGTGWSDSKFTNNLNSFYASATPAMAESDYCVVVGGTTTASTNLPSSAVTYTSSDETKATVGSTTGVITGVAAGTATITAKVGTCTVGTATVTVYAAPSVALSSSSVTYGSSAPTLTPSNFATITGYSSLTTGTATINGSGVISIAGAGTTTFTVTGTDQCGNAANATTGTFTVNKADISPTLSYTSTTLTVGGGNSSNPTVSGNTGNGGVTYSSSNTSVATVNETTGVVTPVAAGSATITATIAATTNYNGNTATATFTIEAADDDCGITLTQFGTQYRTSSPRRLYTYTSNSFDERFIIEASGSNEHGVTYSSTDSLYMFVNNGQSFKVHASDVLKDSIFEDVTKIKFKYRAGKSGKSITLTFDVYVGGTKVGTVSKAITDQTWYTETINVSPAKDGRVIFKNTGSSSDYALHFDEINICGTLPTSCDEITPTWSTDYTSPTLNVGGTSSTPVVGKDGSSGAETFSSSATDIATVNSSGVVTGVKTGTAIITATVAADDENNKCEGTVTKTFTIKAGVTYNKNGADSGDAPTDANTYAANADVTILGNTGSMVEAGKVFNGWNTKSDGTGTHYEVGATMKMPNKSAGVTLYAEWVGYATSWEWWNSGASNGGTSFTYLTDKNYVLSFTTDGDNKATWDTGGGIYYRGVKLKTKDDNMSFWVQSGKEVSITFGTRPTKPTFTVGGVDKSSEVGASTNTDSITVTYTTSADTKFYIENETSTGTAFTIKRVKIENAGVKHNVTFALTNVVYSSGDNEGTNAATEGSDFSVVFAPASRYTLPDDITVEIGGATATIDDDYTWDPSTGELVIDGASITGNIIVTIEGDEGPIPALITYNLQAPDKSTTPLSLDTTSVTTVPATLKGDTLKNFSNMVLGSSFSITGQGKDKDGGTWTAKIGYTPADSTTTDANSVKLSFVVHDDYELNISSITLHTMTVGNDYNLIYRACLSDGVTTAYGRVAPSGGSDATVVFESFSGKKFSGTVTLTLWVWGRASTDFRIKTPIQIDGSLTKKPEPEGFTISFAGNGNTSGSMSDVTAIEEGNSVTLAANGFTKNGYTFANWTADVAVTVNSATVAIGDPIADEATIQNITSDITLTAVWTPNTYDITYNLNGASWADAYSAPATYTVGTGATLPVAGDMTNTGYTFVGWYDNSSLTGSVVTTISTSDYGDKPFWAKWTENTYTVTYSANGGTGDAMSNTVGHYVTLSANTYTKSGYIFAGWNTATDGSGASYSEGEEIELKANLDLYAIWATDYTITWDASPKLSGVAAKPNLGGGNYTITASVATWTGSLTTSMISAETSGVTITGVSVVNSASPKTITATFNVGATVVGDKISFTLDVPANGSYSAKSDTEDFDIDRCTGSSSGSDGVLFSAEFKDSGLGTSDICTAANTAYTFTTAELKAAPTGGSIKAFSTSNLSHMKYATNAISIAGSDGVIQIDLSNAIATNDLFTYLNVNSSTSSAYLRHTSPTTTTDQIALTVYNSKEAKVRLTSGFNGKTTLYIVRNSSDFKLHKAAVVRPAFLMLLRDATPTSDTNLEGTDQELTTLNYLTTINGGRAYYTSPSSGNLKIKRSSSKNYINFNNAAGYVQIVLNDALQEGDVIGFDSYNTNELALTITATRSTTIRTTSQLYTVGSSSPLKGQTTFYLWQNSGSSDYLRGLQIARSGVAGGGGGTDKITTTLTWDTDLSGGVAAETGDADFTHTVTQDKNSLGAITYSSNNTAVATVNASGKVHIAGAGNATITATMAASGCYKEATVSYNITVTDNCADVAGTISTEDLGCSGVRLTVTGHTAAAGVEYQWYKDGGAIDGATSDNYTATTAGEYYVVVTNTGDGHCEKASTNTITLEDSEAATASKIVNSWYVKNGRRTPDIALVQTENATDFTVTSGGSPITTFAGCAFYLGTDGIIYLKGQQEDGSAPTGLTSGDETITITATACGGNASPLDITIHKQESTTRPSVAFVVDGTKEGDFDEEEENHSVNTALYQYLDYGADMTGAFDLTGQNVYSTVDEQAIREHYSQFDAILITDDPSTDTKIGKKSCVDAFGTMIDVRPILTMEAFVSKWGNWKAKGIDGNPESPNPRQYKMKLQCKDHAIFKGLSVGTNVETETIDGVEYWTVTMVDNTKSPYSGVADGTDTDTKPALQGFSADDVSSLLLLGEISGGSLYAGVERQEETAARLMLLGLNAKALPNALTPEGKKVIENALKYLIETDLEKVDDCSNYFTGKTSTDWNTDSNWSKGHVPHSPNVRVRILSECVINSGTYKVAEVDIATSGKSLNKAGEMTGKLTINAGAALIVGGKIRTAKAPYFNTGDLKPTTEEDLVINTSSTAQAALIFDNEDGDTKATVNLYSLGCRPSSYQYQYFAVPMEVVPVNPAFANETHDGTGIYTYVYSEATSGWTRRKYYDDLFAFEGLGITTKSTGAMEYEMTGNLASTATKEITLTHDGAGLNLVGNSWMAPIQIGALAEDNTDANITKTAYIYCAGRDAVEGAATSGVTETAGQWLAVPFEAAEFATWKATGKLSVIPAMQAFEINVSAEATLTLDYDKVVRGSTNDLNAKLRAPGRRMAANEVTMTNIRVADSKTHTDLSLFEGDRFSEAFDNGWEAEYMNGDGRSAKLYAETEAGQMAVAAMYDYEGTVVGFAPGQETEYTFSFMGEDNGYYLNDIKLQNSVRISEGETYTFTYEEGDTENRFYISRTAINAPEVATGMENLDAAASKVQKIIYNDKLYIIRGGRLYDATGKVVK